MTDNKSELKHGADFSADPDNIEQLDMFEEATTFTNYNKFLPSIEKKIRNELFSNDSDGLEKIIKSNGRSSDDDEKIIKIYDDNFNIISPIFENLFELNVTILLQGSIYDHLERLHHCGGIVEVSEILNNTDKFSINSAFGKRLMINIMINIEENKYESVLKLFGIEYFYTDYKLFFEADVIIRKCLQNKINRIRGAPDRIADSCKNINLFIEKISEKITKDYFNSGVKKIITYMAKDITHIERFKKRQYGIEPTPIKQQLILRNQPNRFSMKRFPMIEEFIKLVFNVLFVTVYIDILNLVELDDVKCNPELDCKNDTFEKMEKITTSIPVMVITIHTLIMFISMFIKPFYLKSNQIISYVYHLGMVATLTSYLMYIGIVFKYGCSTHSEVIIDIFGTIFLYKKFQKIIRKINEYNEECRTIVGIDEYDKIQYDPLVTIKDYIKKIKASTTYKKIGDWINRNAFDLFVQVVLILLVLAFSIAATWVEIS